MIVHYIDHQSISKFTKRSLHKRNKVNWKAITTPNTTACFTFIP